MKEKFTISLIKISLLCLQSVKTDCTDHFEI